MTSIRIQGKPRFPRTFFRRYTSLAVLADETARYHCYEQIKDQLPSHRLIVIPTGERHKNLDTCKSVWQQMTDAGLDRHSVLVAIGGGVVCDLGGFCASTFKRGIDFVLIPTTLLAMADAGVGGKTGIDLGRLKNHLGTFAMPTATWIATAFLQTLPRSELRSGFAEVIKHAILSNRGLFKALTKKSLTQQNWTNLVKKSVTFKTSVIRKDPREGGLRKILNYGHTLGHALEGHALMTEKPMLHGEAIAAGMVMEAHIGWKRGMVPETEFKEIRDYILKVFGKAEVPADDKWMESIRQDKKNKGKTVLMALPKGIGKASYDIPVSDAEIRAAVAYYRKTQM